MTRATALALGFLSILPSFHLSIVPSVVAQVGHDPGRSPFHDIRRGAGPVFSVGYLSGARGRAGVGISDGVTFGARYEIALAGPTLFSLGAAYGQTDRFIVDPFNDAATRKSGPVEDDVIIADLGLQLRLTGAKSWHGFAPYVGAALGLAFGSDVPSDTSDYQFGAKLIFAPAAGLRWYPTRRIHVQADARLLFWKLKYPLTFRQPSPDGSRVLPIDDPLSEWTRHPWISLGVGWTF